MLFCSRWKWRWLWKKGAFDYKEGNRGVARTPVSARVLVTDWYEGQFPFAAAGCRDNCPLSLSAPGFWQSSLQSPKGHCRAKCRRDGCPSEHCLCTAPFITISHHNIRHQRKSSFLASARAERNPLVWLRAGVKLFSLRSPLDLNPAWPAAAACCCQWLQGWETPALAHPQGAAAGTEVEPFGRGHVPSQQPGWGLYREPLPGSGTIGAQAARACSQRLFCTPTSLLPPTPVFLHTWSGFF